MGSAALYRHNADDCCQRSLQARTPADKANWLKIAEEWQQLAEQVDVSNAPKENETMTVPRNTGRPPMTTR